MNLVEVVFNNGNEEIMYSNLGEVTAKIIIASIAKKSDGTVNEPEQTK